MTPLAEHYVQFVVLYWSLNQLWMLHGIRRMSPFVSVMSARIVADYVFPELVAVAVVFAPPRAAFVPAFLAANPNPRNENYYLFPVEISEHECKQTSPSYPSPSRSPDENRRLRNEVAEPKPCLKLEN